jgi:hypothetical protein
VPVPVVPVVPVPVVPVVLVPVVPVPVVPVPAVPVVVSAPEVPVPAVPVPAVPVPVVPVVPVPVVPVVPVVPAVPVVWAETGIVAIGRVAKLMAKPLAQTNLDKSKFFMLFFLLWFSIQVFFDFLEYCQLIAVISWIKVLFGNFFASREGAIFSPHLKQGGVRGWGVKPYCIKCKPL